jgi:hypothetical protein
MSTLSCPVISDSMLRKPMNEVYTYRTVGINLATSYIFKAVVNGNPYSPGR